MTEGTGRDGDTEATSTRRRYLAGATAVLGGGALAGCSGVVPSTGGSEGEESYTAEISPVGEVSFEAEPRSVYTGLPNTIDMAVASGASERIDAAYYPQYHGTLLSVFYDRLEGVEWDYEAATDSWNMGKEGFYELDADVHLTDPAYASTLDTLDADDVGEIRENVAPWFGNYYSDQRRSPPDGWAEDYQYYSLWEIYQRVADVFQAGDRADALRGVRESMGSKLQSGLPAESERPSVGLAFPGEGDTLWAYKLNADGFLTAHTRPMGATDAFGHLEFGGPQTQIDYEGLIDADPDVLLLLFTTASSYSIAETRAKLEDDPVASRVAAVENDRVFAQGARYQGPIMNLFQTEMTAKQMYPEQFGAWPGYVDGDPYPEIPAEEQLFDRDRVAEIVRGEL